MSLLSPQLIAFMAVCDKKTVHAAAESLFLTQTAVTQRVRGLERSLKTTLFTRSRRGMLLTPEGEALLRYCQASRVLEGETLASISGAAIDSEVELSITAATSIMRARVMPSCLAVMQEFPNLLLHFYIDDSNQRAASLRKGEHDFAIITSEQLTAEMRYKSLQAEEYVLVAASHWRGRRLKDILMTERIVDFAVDDQFSFNYLKHYDLYESANPRRYFVNSTEHLAYLVTQGVGYSTLPKQFAQPFLDRGEMMVLNRNRSYLAETLLAWYDRPEPPAYFTAIINGLV
jgi:LysR family transcriptional regulator, chromosome initiation inhibitor